MVPRNKEIRMPDTNVNVNIPPVKPDDDDEKVVETEKVTETVTETEHDSE